MKKIFEKYTIYCMFLIYMGMIGLIYLISLNTPNMMEEPDLNNNNVTRITLDKATETVTVEVPGTNLAYTEFMELVELLIANAGYSKDEVESYITDWANDIRATKEN